MSRRKTVSSWMQRAQSSCSGVVHLHCRPCKLEVNSVRESLKKNTILLYKCSCVAVSATIELSDALNNLITYLKPLLTYSGLSRNSIPKPQLDHVLRLTIELNSVIVIDAPSLGWWLCGFVAWRKKKWLVWPPRQNWLSHLKCEWRCWYSWRVSNVSLAQDWLGQTVTHSCCNGIQ